MCVCVCACFCLTAAVSATTVGTPERIELEDYGRSLTQLEAELLLEPEEVPEEMLSRFRMSLDEKSRTVSPM